MAQSMKSSSVPHRSRTDGPTHGYSAGGRYGTIHSGQKSASSRYQRQKSPSRDSGMNTSHTTSGRRFTRPSTGDNRLDHVMRFRDPRNQRPTARRTGFHSSGGTVAVS